LPAAELAVWLVPGYLALLLFLHVNPLRSKQSYEWFFQAAGFGILSYLIALSLASAWNHTFGLLPAWSPGLGKVAATVWWKSHFPLTNSDLWVVAVLASPLVATVASWGRMLFSAAQQVVTSLSPRSRPSDILLFRCRQMERQLVLAGVEGGRLYVGFLTDFTTDPDEPDRYIEIVPIMSGRRNDETGLVEYTTPYFTSSTLPAEARLKDIAKCRAMLIPVKKLLMFAPFDSELHKRLWKKGLVKVLFDVDEAEE
jgi:hypothetical protein